MTVKELIEILKLHNPDAAVVLLSEGQYTYLFRVRANFIDTEELIFDGDNYEPK